MKPKYARNWCVAALVGVTALWAPLASAQGAAIEQQSGAGLRALIQQRAAPASSALLIQAGHEQDLHLRQAGGAARAQIRVDADTIQLRAEQLGGAHELNLRASGRGHRIASLQTGGAPSQIRAALDGVDHRLQVSQFGTGAQGNDFQARLEGREHEAIIAQTALGGANWLRLDQSGEQHSAQVTQNGADNQAELVQHGHGHSLRVAQFGLANRLRLAQHGESQQAPEIVQTGGAQVEIVQRSR